jgi:hypothetical protein
MYVLSRAARTAQQSTVHGAVSHGTFDGRTEALRTKAVSVVYVRGWFLAGDEQARCISIDCFMSVDAKSMCDMPLVCPHTRSSICTAHQQVQNDACMSELGVILCCPIRSTYVLLQLHLHLHLQLQCDSIDIRFDENHTAIFRTR